ncbi:hypothetical protein Tco_0975752 [Tanacetum coccineum]|uniref:Uncharacterized protein n=1 Tax=Tanacetum coccineum TaxID=301880 RepID=A0ABQ5EFD5_9ASTR
MGIGRNTVDTDGRRAVDELVLDMLWRTGVIGILSRGDGYTLLYDDDKGMMSERTQHTYTSLGDVWSPLNSGVRPYGAQVDSGVSAQVCGGNYATLSCVRTRSELEMLTGLSTSIASEWSETEIGHMRRVYSLCTRVAGKGDQYTMDIIGDDCIGEVDTVSHWRHSEMGKCGSHFSVTYIEGLMDTDVYERDRLCEEYIVIRGQGEHIAYAETLDLFLRMRVEYRCGSTRSSARDNYVGHTWTRGRGGVAEERRSRCTQSENDRVHVSQKGESFIVGSGLSGDGSGERHFWSDELGQMVERIGRVICFLRCRKMWFYVGWGGGDNSCLDGQQHDGWELGVSTSSGDPGRGEHIQGVQIGIEYMYTWNGRGREEDNDCEYEQDDTLNKLEMVLVGGGDLEGVGEGRAAVVWVGSDLRMEDIDIERKSCVGFCRRGFSHLVEWRSLLRGVETEHNVNMVRVRRRVIAVLDCVNGARASLHSKGGCGSDLYFEVTHMSGAVRGSILVRCCVGLRGGVRIWGMDIDEDLVDDMSQTVTVGDNGGRWDFSMARGSVEGMSGRNRVWYIGFVVEIGVGGRVVGIYIKIDLSTVPAHRQAVTVADNQNHSENRSHITHMSMSHTGAVEVG